MNMNSIGRFDGFKCQSTGPASVRGECNWVWVSFGNGAYVEGVRTNPGAHPLQVVDALRQLAGNLEMAIMRATADSHEQTT